MLLKQIFLLIKQHMPSQGPIYFISSAYMNNSSALNGEPLRTSSLGCDNTNCFPATLTVLVFFVSFILKIIFLVRLVRIYVLSLKIIFRQNFL